MSDHLLNRFVNFENFKYCKENNSFIMQNKEANVDVEELLDITYILENSFIPYKIVENFEIKLLEKKM